MVGVSTEAYVAANMRLAMHVKANEGVLNQLGITTRGVNGNLLSQTEIMQNAVTAMEVSTKLGLTRINSPFTLGEGTLRPFMKFCD